jgi:hypothetical protein
MEQWSNNACLGYVIEGAKALGYTDKHIEELVKAVRGQFDWTSVGEAAEVYNKSPY